MTLISHIRKNLFASVLLLSSSLATSALAEDTQLLPELNASQIAQDVTREFNNRTGIEEFIAPTFDPFEEDRTMAGSVSLRSVGAPVTSIDGETLRDGAMLDVMFYYNTPNDDPYEGRGFTDIAFLSGSLAPAVRRDNRILECSRNVEDVVYDDRFYYAPLLVSLRLNRPYRHYGGHRGFGRFDRPFWRTRGYYGGQSGWSRRGYTRHVDRGTRRSDSRRADSRRDDGRRGDRVRDNRNDDRTRTDRNRDRNRDNARDRRRENRTGTSYVRSDRRGRMRGNVSNDRLRAENRADNNRRSETRRTDTRRSETRAANNRTRDTRRVERDNVRVRNEGRSTPQVRTQPRTQPRAQPRAQPRSQPRAQPRSTPRAEPRRSESRPRNDRRTSNNKRNSNRSVLNTVKSNRGKSSRKNNLRRGLDFFPQRSNYGRSVVRNVDVNCAREESLSVFIPAARLDAARFDGLTVLALDNQGQEFPIFIPPNYIEGFEAAVGGRFKSSADLGTSIPRAIYQAPSGTVSRGVISRPSQQTQAACPTGTQKQPNGTCLVVEGGYP